MPGHIGPSGLILPGHIGPSGLVFQGYIGPSGLMFFRTNLSLTNAPLNDLKTGQNHLMHLIKTISIFDVFVNVRITSTRYHLPAFKT